ncbi:MAG: hypothetical protein HQM08_00970 [Candidatus Riflebacteria bacterium]|nr:hypothetical protein [Candidatus Riflebacteria bacterium]
MNLLEILIATIIMAFSMIPIAGIMGKGHEGTEKDFRRTEAIHIAETAMNEALKLPYNQVPIGSLTSDWVAASGTVRLGTVKGTYSYQVSLNVTNEAISFSYCPVDLNNAAYNPDDSSTWVFSNSTNSGALFDGGSLYRPFLLKRYEINVSWVEPSGVQPPTIVLVTSKANLDI